MLCVVKMNYYMSHKSRMADSCYMIIIQKAIVNMVIQLCIKIGMSSRYGVTLRC